MASDQLGATASDPLSFDPNASSAVAARAYRTISLLARWLLEEYHFGFLSAAQVQMAAKLATTDGIENEVLNKLASLGTNGRHANKVAGEIDKYMETYIKPATFPKAQGREIPLKVCKGPMTGYHLMQQYYNLPHVWFAFVYKHFRQIYEARIRGEAGVLATFRRDMEPSGPRLKIFSILRDSAIEARTYPSSSMGMGCLAPSEARLIVSVSRVSLRGFPRPCAWLPGMSSSWSQA